MEDSLDVIKKLIDGLKQYKPINFEPTYLEICRYPTSRFEEINSRILSFFFKPNNPHGFGTFFLNVLSKCLNLKDLDWLDASVETEVHTHIGNRIDLLIHSKSCVICIENKIWAELYNDLGDYKNFVENKYRDVPEKKYVVLTLKNLSGNEKQNCKNAQFEILQYRDFISKLKSSLGDVVTDCNQRYLSYFIDWIQTMKNEEYGMGSNFSDEEKNYIQKNHEEVKNFMERVTAYDRECENIFNNNVACDMQKILQSTDSSIKKYWCNPSWFLYQSEKHIDKMMYGIDAARFQRKPYSSEKESFLIRIRSWDGNKKCEPVINKIKETFGKDMRCEYFTKGPGGGYYIEVQTFENLDDPELLAKWLLEQKVKLDSVLKTF